MEFGYKQPYNLLWREDYKVPILNIIFSSLYKINDTLV